LATKKKPASGTVERREALKRSLVAAAEQAVRKQGLAGINARDLARRAGCALGAIYNVFPDLDAIVYEVNSRTLSAFERFLAARRRRGTAAAGDDRQRAIDDLVDLATAYLDFAKANQPRWRALFEHRLATPGARLPEWYVEDQRRLFGLVEEPLAALRPDLSAPDRRALARAMFSAVHGIVTLGLDEKLMSLTVADLAGHLTTVVTALGRGLQAGGPA
jgi:AcrR family transcriptional regulator